MRQPSVNNYFQIQKKCLKPRGNDTDNVKKYQRLCMFIASYLSKLHLKFTLLSFITESIMGIYILLFEISIIILYGVFVRTGTTTLSLSVLSTPLYFTLGTSSLTEL